MYFGTTPALHTTNSHSVSDWKWQVPLLCLSFLNFSEDMLAIF